MRRRHKNIEDGKRGVGTFNVITITSSGFRAFALGVLVGTVLFGSPLQYVYSLLRRQDDKNECTMQEENIVSKTSDYTHSAWCPDAACHNSDICRPCRRRFLIILATGRSGSTTLTYMLDSLPGVRMAGENNNQLNAIRRMIDNIRSNPKFQYGTSRKCAWGHAPVPEGAYSCVAQTMMETINPPILTAAGRLVEDDADTIIGFKSIRFLPKFKDENDVRDLAEWITEMFPCARFVLNIYSNTTEQAFSVHKTFANASVEECEKKLSALSQNMKEFAKLLGDRAILLDSYDWFDDISHLNRAVEWLGFSQKCYFDRLLEFNVKGITHGVTELVHDPNCRYVGNDKHEKD